MRCSLAFLLLSAAATAAAGQTISGRVTDRTSGFPVSGVVVSGLDSAGASLVRTVTDSASGYLMPILPRMARLSFRRIGYAPAEVALKDSANGRLDVSMTRLPTRLPPVKAVVSAQCDARANGPDVLALWEQARSGMLTSLVAHESKAAYTSVLIYQNGFNGDDETPRAVERIELPAGTSHPFGTGVDPAELARTGYMVRDGFQNAFLAPDEGVLFDDSFLTTHCFTLEPVAGDSLIGIRFEPGKTNKLVDVKGVVWLRRDPLDLASMEYSYANIDRTLERARPGGSLRFRQMPNGITMIQEWRIRSAAASAPLFSVSRAAPPLPPPPPTIVRGRGGAATIRRGGSEPAPPRTINRPAVVTASETGAIIEMMQWTDAPPFVAPLGSINGVLIDKQTRQPLANTAVRLFRTPFATTTDSTGAFTLIDVLPGLYELDAGEPELERYDAAPELVSPIAIKFGPNQLKVEIDGPIAAIERGCGEKEGRVVMPQQFGGPNAVFGTIIADRRTLAAQEFVVGVLPAGAVAGTSPFPLKGKTDRAGRFRICGLPNGTTSVSTQLRDMGVSDSVSTDPHHPYRFLTLTLKKPPG